MKKFKSCLAYLVVLSMFFTSCSKEESGVTGSDEDTVQLQLGALLNNFETRQASKAHLSDPTECREAAPAYVRLGLTDDATGFFVGGAGNTDPFLINVNIKNNGGSWETEYSEVLGLPAGDYTLQYFIVYSSDNEVLWVAPRAGGDYASSVGSPLPMAIDLEAGTKPYIMVDVLCYIPRNEEAYGYVFFDIELTTVTNNYCIFVNYCDEGTGREYPAKFMVDVWADGYDGTDVVKNGAMNLITQPGVYPAASVLCFPLPPLSGDDTYFVRVTVLDDALLGYSSDTSDFVQFEISQADIAAQLLDTPRYEHLRINCGTPPDDCPITPQDTDGDCVPDGDDICPGFDDSIDTDGDGLPDGCDPCPYVHKDLDNDGDCVPDNDDICPGFDDNVDTDGDGVPDGCDICAGDDNADADGDGVPDACDTCAGGDDYIDSDGDGTPDYCDQEDTDLEGCETAFMFGNNTLISLDLGNKRWGWAEYFEGGNGTYSYNVYAGAGQNDIDKGTLVGKVELTVSAGNVAVKYTLNSGVVSNVTHIYFSDNNAPTTTAPGQYGNTYEDNYTGSKTWNFSYSNDGNFWIIVHSEVCPDND